ncbi:MAG TPA: lytic murein transglycosylase [Parcubacteria group bacterium]|nr:lytic murein transglycosylase [Parcubacteria group bacterium]
MSERLFLMVKNLKFVTILFVFVLIFLSPSSSFAITQEEQEAIWRAELAQTEADIAKWQSILSSTKANTKSLQEEAALLNAKIKQAQAVIKQRNINIAQLGNQIKDKQKKILTLEQKIEKGHDSLAQLIRKTNEIDEFSLPEVVLGNKDISEFFSDVDDFQSIKRSLAELFEDIRETKTLTEKEKQSLGEAQDKELDTKAAVEAQKKEVEKNEKEKQYLISVNKTQEKTYEQVIADRQKKAAEIKAKLFKLAGGSAAIPFGTALTYAQSASAKTGVSPAFILAILTQESSLGANVGKCYLTDTSTGAGVNTAGTKSFPNVMKSPRDTVPFLEITNRLGFDWKTTVVSCPIAGVAGYGGAMGPAQFIPSTWHIFDDKLKDIFGTDSNPWNPEHAFMASALFLSDLGAKTATFSAESRAACRYYGGGASTCSYSRSVMKLKDSIQADIDYLNQYGVSRR